MRIADFELERFFARWEFAVRYLLCASDVEGYPMADLLALADEEARALWDGLRLGYTESTGHPLLRREIAALYETLDADDILTFAGAEEAIFCLANVLVGPGDHVIVTWPAYQSLHEVARSAGAAVTLHELRDENGWVIDLDLLRRQVRPETRLIVVNAPHNPTGMLPDRSTWDGLVAIATDAGAYLLSDEVYRYLEFDEAERLPAGADALPTRGISLGVMSKSFAMAGLRIGWLATTDRELLPRVRRGRAPAGGRRCTPNPGHLARGHVEVVRDGRLADRLARDHRSRAARPAGGLQGLHDDLLVGAVRDSRDHRPPGARPRAGPLALDRRDEHGAPRPLLRRVGRHVHVGPAAGRLDRLPEAP